MANREIRNGERLAEESFPVPTIKNQDCIYLKEHRKSRFYGRIKQDGIAEIDKPTFSDSDDRKVPYMKYDFMDCMTPGIGFHCKTDAPITDWPSYKQLQDITAYAFLDNGMIFVKSEKVYFLSETDRRFYHLARAPKNTISANIRNNGDIAFRTIHEYKQTVFNQRYERCCQDYTGYTDEYEITIINQILKREKFDSLLKERRQSLANEGRLEQRKEETACGSKRRESSADDQAMPIEERWDRLMKSLEELAE